MGVRLKDASGAVVVHQLPGFTAELNDRARTGFVVIKPSTAPTRSAVGRLPVPHPRVAPAQGEERLVRSLLRHTSVLTDPRMALPIDVTPQPSASEVLRETLGRMGARHGDDW